MTSTRDLGPVLAVAGGAVIVAAVIAGFIAVGGPGDARDRRLDEMTVRKMNSLAHASQCAFNMSGKTYSSVEEMHSVAQDAARVVVSPDCGYVDPLPNGAGDIGSDGNPENAGEIDYARIDGSHVRVCGNFRLPFDPDKREGYRLSVPGADFAGFDAARPAGPNCYTIELIKRPSAAAPAAAEIKPSPALTAPSDQRPRPN